jgi:hypothetical protein
LDNIDNVIWILPFLALFDVISTFYAWSKVSSLQGYNWELFASFFVGAGSIYAYFYAVIYVLIVVGIAYVLLYVKNKVLKPNRTPDRIIFLVLVGVVFYIYMRISAALLMNFFLPTIIERGLNMVQLPLIIYAGSALSLGFYVWDTVLAWMRSSGDKKKK